MPVSLTYNYAATACPALLVSGALLNPASANTSTPTATHAAELQTGDTAFDMGPKFGRNAVRLDNVGRYGGGGYAICEGLAPSITSGLTVAWTAGWAGVDSGIYVAAASKSCTDNATSHFWVLSDGTVSSAQSTTTPPTGAAVYLGRFTAVSGAITEMDQSGVLFRRKGGLFRRTGDTDIPADTPPADHLIDTQTQSGIFRWNGTSYSRPGMVGRYPETFASADKTLPAAQYNKAFLQAQGTNAGAQNWILPLIDGLAYDVSNATGSAVTFKGATGTGVAVATGKAARIRTDGTNYIRITPDT